MVKKELIFSILLVLLLIPFTAAANQTKIDKGYDCLKNRVNETSCERMSLEETVFSSLAVGKCTDHLINNIDSPEQGKKCWSGEYLECKLDLTAKGILALEKQGKDTEKHINWLSSQNKTPDELNWFLQIHTSKDPSSCEISYNGNTYTVKIEDNTFSSEAGSCLLVSDNGYWLTIPSSCYNAEFEISCNSSFSTNLLFREQGETTINVLGETTSAERGGTTEEKVSSLCFEQGGRCSYEGTLWAAMVLDYLGKDVSKYMPYIIALKDEKRQYLPSSFLYSLTGKTRYKSELMDLRSPAGYWEQSGNKYYDTSLAMYFLQGSEIYELNKTKQWFLDEQEEKGCWNNGNIRDTSFILYSTWPREVSGNGGGEPPTPETICSDVEGHCIYRSECEDAGGKELTEYSDTCPGMKICCNESSESKKETCADLAGDQDFSICSYNEDCVDGEVMHPYSLEAGKTCCVGGTCEEWTYNGGEANCVENDGSCRSSCHDDEEIDYSYTCEGDKKCCMPSKGEEANCIENDGSCRSSCHDDEKESTFYTCEDSDKVCCMPSKEPSGVGWWIWVLIVLIILVALGIIFKDKLKQWWIRSGKGKGGGGGRARPRGPSGRPPGPPPGGRRPSQGRNVPRRIMPRQNQPSQQRPQRGKGSKELDDVLGKLKEMGK